MTVQKLIALLQQYPADAEAVVFCPFDSEGPNTWNEPQLGFEVKPDGTMEVRIQP